MSSEELKIRGELEMEVERELEEEIKDGICHLALRLHRLYQQQKERDAKELSNFGIKNQQGKNNKILSEVNINIKMEGGTRIEIKEIKKQARDNRPRIPRTENLQGRGNPNCKKFDWEKSLRSGTNSVPIQNKIDRSGRSTNTIIYGNRAKTGMNASQQHKVNTEANNTLLEFFVE